MGVLRNLELAAQVLNLLALLLDHRLSGGGGGETLLQALLDVF